MSAVRLATQPLRSVRRLYSTATPTRLASVQSTSSTAAAAASTTAGPALSAAAIHASGPLRNDWTREEIQAIYDSPFMDLMYYGVSHRQRKVLALCLLQYRPELMTYALSAGKSTPRELQRTRSTAVHALVHQNRWMHRRLQILPPVLAVQDVRCSPKNAWHRCGPRGCPAR